ncbi:hypothetical protein [Methanobrevibacter sp.]
MGDLVEFTVTILNKGDTKTTGNPLVLLARALLFAGVGLRCRKE